MDRHPRRWLILIVLCLSMMVLVIDNGVLTVAIPPLTEDLGATAQDIQLIIAGYIVMFAGLLLTAGSLSDRYGRRKIMIIGLVVFGAASLLATYAGSPEQLIAGRILMGVGGALVMPSTLSILIVVFDDEERRKAMSIWSSVLVVGVVGGPVLGGVLIAHYWWGSVFLINVPIVVLTIVAALVLMPESKGPARKTDLPGAVLSIVGLATLVWVIIELPNGGLAAPTNQFVLAVSVLSLIGFVVRELRTPYPMVPLSLFRDRNFTGGSLSLMLLQVAYGGLLLALTQYLQLVLGYTPTQAGLALAPIAAAVIVTNTLASTLGQKIGNRALTVSGLVVLAGGFALLTTLAPGDSFWLMGSILVVFGIGAGLAQPAAIAALMGAVPPEHAGVGSALNDTVAQGGAALGVAALGSILAGSFTDAMPASAPEAARGSLGEALVVATQTSDTGLAAAARTAFTDSMATTFLMGTCAVAGAAILALVLIRDRKQTADEPTQPAMSA